MHGSKTWHMKSHHMSYKGKIYLPMKEGDEHSREKDTATVDWLVEQGYTGRLKEKQQRKNYLDLGPRLRLPQSMHRTEAIKKRFAPLLPT